MKLKGPTEHQIQAALFAWAAVAKVTIPQLMVLYAIPNAARRTPRQGWYMKNEGLRAGVPDVCLPVPRHPYGALYIEHKSEDGRLTEQQSWWIATLRATGNMVVVSRSFPDSRDAILRYLALGEGEKKAP